MAASSPSPPSRPDSSWVSTPSVVVLAGPNGAGKSSLAPLLLQGVLGVTEFVNADVIARGLSGFNEEGAAVAAGRVMLARLRDLARQRFSFAFEATLASRSLAPWIERLKGDGYVFHLVFLWLPNPELAVARIGERVRMGGHGVPADTVRRRYRSGLRNFFALYRPLATTWRLYDNSARVSPRLVAAGEGGGTTVVADSRLWEEIVQRGHGASE